jgi:hypothetical protein
MDRFLKLNDPKEGNVDYSDRSLFICTNQENVPHYVTWSMETQLEGSEEGKVNSSLPVFA